MAYKSVRVSYAYRLEIAALINSRLEAAGIDLSFDRATACAAGVTLILPMDGATSSTAVLAAAAYPGGVAYDSIGHVFWAC